MLVGRRQKLQFLCYMSPCVTWSCPVDRVKVGVPGKSWQHRLLGLTCLHACSLLLCAPGLPSAETLSTRCLQHGKRRSPPQRDTEGAPRHSQPMKLWPFLLPPLRALWSQAEESRGLLCQCSCRSAPRDLLQLLQFSKWEKGGRPGLCWRLLPLMALELLSEPAASSSQFTASAQQG